MADVHCPMGMIRPMDDCTICTEHIKNGTSLEWCSYKVSKQTAAIKESTTEELPINVLEMQMRQKIGKADFFYKTGKTRIADNLSDEAARIERKIRRKRRDEQRNT
jgi:hypothetical protein